jgi:hypothetical protein
MKTLLKLSVAGLCLACGLASAAPPAPAKSTAKPATKAVVKATAPAPLMEQRALDVLKAASDRLAGARSMAFTAITTHENPSALGPPLLLTTQHEVLLARPDKLRVITSGDGTASEFYYDGKVMMALVPADNLLAVAEAPPTIDEALEAAYKSAQIYYSFTDLIVADPYKDLANGLKQAYYVGQSKVVGGTTTDIVAYIVGDVFVQIWIGTEDKLPRLVRAIYRKDPLQHRFAVVLSNWQLDMAVPPDAFATEKAASAKRIPFAKPYDAPPPGAAMSRPAAK